MQLEQSFDLPCARAAAWPAFADVAMLVACMPGATLEGAPRPAEGGTELDLLFTVKLGPITGAFQGKGVIRRDEATHAGAFAGAGADRKSGSRVKGEARFTLTEVAPGETRVDVMVDYQLSGPLAQFSRGAIVKELAAAMTRDFAANLRERLQAVAAPAGAEPARSGAAAVADDGAGAPAAALDAGRLVRRALWARILAWFGRTAR